MGFWRTNGGADFRSNCKVAIALCLIFLYIFTHIINADAVKQTKNMREI